MRAGAARAPQDSRPPVLKRRFFAVLMPSRSTGTSAKSYTSRNSTDRFSKPWRGPARFRASVKGNSHEAAGYPSRRGILDGRRGPELPGAGDRTKNPTTENGDRLARRLAGTSVERGSLGTRDPSRGR